MLHQLLSVYACDHDLCFFAVLFMRFQLFTATIKFVLESYK